MTLTGKMYARAPFNSKVPMSEWNWYIYKRWVYGLFVQHGNACSQIGIRNGFYKKPSYSTRYLELMK